MVFLLYVKTKVKFWCGQGPLEWFFFLEKLKGKVDVRLLMRSRDQESCCSLMNEPKGQVDDQ